MNIQVTNPFLITLSVTQAAIGRPCLGWAKPPCRYQENGSALIVSLIILLLMTIIGITAMSTSTLEEKMAGNMRNLNLAFQAAESAMRSGEIWIGAPMPKPAGAATCGSPPCDLWQYNGPGNFMTLGRAWWGANGRAGPDLNEVATDPLYVIEERDFLKDSLCNGFKSCSDGGDVYRITARGTGGTDDAQVILQNSVIRRF